MRKNIHGAFLISVIYDWQLCWWLEDRHDVAADDADRWDQGDLEGRRNCFWHWTLKGYGTSLCMPESVFYTIRGSCGVNMSLTLFLAGHSIFFALVNFNLKYEQWNCKICVRGDFSLLLFETSHKHISYEKLFSEELKSQLYWKAIFSEDWS